MIPQLTLQPSLPDKSALQQNRVWLYDGVTILTRGQGEPSGMASGRWGLATVQGQPARPGGGGGSSVRVGLRILAHAFQIRYSSSKGMPFRDIRSMVVLAWAYSVSA